MFTGQQPGGLLAAEHPSTVDDYNALDNNDYSLEELMEELTEEPRVGSVGQQKENIVDLSSVIITATASELREIDTGPDLDLGALDQMHDLDDFNGIMDDINLTTIDDAEGINFPESGRDQSSYLPDSSWGPIFGTTMWNNIAMGTITDFVVGHENLAGLLPTRSGRGLGCGSATVDIQGKFKEEEQTFLSASPESPDFEELPLDVSHLVEALPPSLQEEQLLLADSIPPASQEEQPGITSHDFKSMEKTESGAAGTLAQEELCAPTRTPDASNIENYNNNYHCSIVPSVIIDADIDEGEVDEDPPTRSEYDQTNKGESITIMEVIAGTDVKKKDDTVVVATEGSYLSPYKALLRAGDFVFTGQPPGGRLSPRAVSTGGASSAPFPFGGQHHGQVR